LRHDPIFKMTVGHEPESGDPLCSQPTMSRLENMPSKIEIARMKVALVDGFCESYRRRRIVITETEKSSKVIRTANIRPQ